MSKAYFVTLYHKSGFSYTFPSDENGKIICGRSDKKEYDLYKTLRHFVAVERGYKENGIAHSTMTLSSELSSENNRYISVENLFAN